MSYLILIPSIWPPYTAACLATLKAPAESIMVVDNTVNNIGVAASWNRGVDRVVAEGTDWLVLMSAACRFGEPGGLDFLDALDDHAGAWAVEATEPEELLSIGWHLIGIARSTFERVGRFDEIFVSYLEDLDMSLRIRIVAKAFGGWDPLWPKPHCQVTIASQNHGVALGGAVVPDGPTQLAKWQAKWLGPSGFEKTQHPYGRPELPITFTGPPPP